MTDSFKSFKLHAMKVVSLGSCPWKAHMPFPWARPMVLVPSHSACVRAVSRSERDEREGSRCSRNTFESPCDDPGGTLGISPSVSQHDL